MGTLIKLHCQCCDANWVVSATDRDSRTIFCEQCSDFVVINRIPYSHSRFNACWKCGTDNSSQTPIDQSLVKCPRCKMGVLSFADCGSFLADNSVPMLNCGDIVEGFFDSWAVHIFDLPAIPRENVQGIDNGIIDGIWCLEVVDTPKLTQRDREYYFRIIGPL